MPREVMEFRWNEWNLEHVAEHGVSPQEAEAIVCNARRPYPRRLDDDKWLVRGRGVGGRLLQVIYFIDPNETFYIIHARPLTKSEKKRFRKRR